MNSDLSSSACGFFSSTACFADFYDHPRTVTVKKDCDPNGNNCKVLKKQGTLSSSVISIATKLFYPDLLILAAN